MKEEFRPVVGFEGLYEVSNMGRVFSLNYNSQGFTQEMKQTKNHDGYLQLQLYKDKNMHTKRVHRLVAEAFLNNDENFSDVNHIDANRENNNVSNLEWCTHDYNVKHSVALGNYIGKFGKDNPNYGNKRLSKFYKDNPDISKEKQSRPAEQNGRATKIEMINTETNECFTFEYIALCCKYLMETGETSSKNVESVRSRINACIREGRKYKGKYIFNKLIKQ